MRIVAGGGANSLAQNVETARLRVFCPIATLNRHVLPLRSIFVLDLDRRFCSSCV
jgi:hypothetical protein